MMTIVIAVGVILILSLICAKIDNDVPRTVLALVILVASVVFAVFNAVQPNPFYLVQIVQDYGFSIELIPYIIINSAFLLIFSGVVLTLLDAFGLLGNKGVGWSQRIIVWGAGLVFGMALVGLWFAPYYIYYY
ncbi:MAG: hypothetical protein FWG63_04640 [Defluviitaleaceae bacterium]|nr:hypothetical protein [Defluviitaleaceae bacterium]